MKSILTGTTNWTVDQDEVSMGVYRLVATNEYGSRIEDSGSDPDAMLAQATLSAHKIDADIAHFIEERKQQRAT